MTELRDSGLITRVREAWDAHKSGHDYGQRSYNELTMGERDMVQAVAMKLEMDLRMRYRTQLRAILDLVESEIERPGS